MLYVPGGFNTFGKILNSYGTTRPAAAFGTAVTPSTAGYGTYAQLISGGSNPDESYGILINVNGNFDLAANCNTIIQIGIDPAGGSSYTAIISDLMCGNASSYIESGSGQWWYFPIYIPPGASVGVSAYGTVATAFSVNCQLYQKPAAPHMLRVGKYCTNVGIASATRTGTSITPGTTAEGAWTSLGTTARGAWWWQISMQVTSSDTSFYTGVFHIDLAYGDSSNKHMIIENAHVYNDSHEYQTSPAVIAGCERDLPAGTTLYARAQKSSNLDVYTIAAYGIGG